MKKNCALNIIIFAVTVGMIAGCSSTFNTNEKSAQSIDFTSDINGNSLVVDSASNYNYNQSSEDK